MRRSVVWPLAFAGVLAVLAAAPASAVDVQAGPIFNNMDAQNKCPNVCRQNGNGRWTGQWHTIQGTATSVCDCDVPSRPVTPSSATQWVEAGPLFSQFDAQNKCPNVCQRSGGGTWDGNWKTTEPGRMSVCSCGGQRLSPGFGAGSSCSARGRGGCSGCSVQCAPGQRASCREGSTWNDKLGNGDQGCVTGSQCTCS